MCQQPFFSVFIHLKANIRYVMPSPVTLQCYPLIKGEHKAHGPFTSNQRRTQVMWPSIVSFNPSCKGEPKVHGLLLLSFSVATILVS